MVLNFFVLIRKEFSLLSISEALGYREQCIRFRVKRSDHLPDIVREVQTEIESFHSMLEASVIAAQLQDVRISEGDQFLLYMRNLPGKVQEFLQLHQNATTVQQLFLGVQDYYIRTRVQGDHGFNSCDTACREARCQGQDMLQTVERRAI